MISRNRNIINMPSALLRCFKHPLFPIFQLGFGFYLILTSFQSCSVIQVAVLQSAAQSNGTSTIGEHAGYYSLAIIYAVLTFCNLFASPLVLLLTAKWSMVIGALTNVLYLSSFLYLKTELLYTASAVLGFGSALLWVGQGNYITLASDISNVGRNGAIVWAIFQLSLPTGGFFLYSQFSKSGDEIDPCTVKTVFMVFTFLSTFGCLNFALLKPLKVSSEDRAGLLECASEGNSPSVDSVAITSIQPTVSIFGEAISTLKMLKSGKMILLSIVFYYSGALLTFWSAVYGTSLSFTRQFLPPTKILLALNAVFIGFGETSGAVVVSLFNSKIEAYGRPVVIITGAFVNFLTFFVVFLMIPALAPLVPTDDVSYIAPNKYLAMGCSFFFGFGDSCWNTQIYATLSKQFANESTRAFSLFKFMQSLAAAIAFSYSSRLLLHWQLTIVSILCFLAAMAYCKVPSKFALEMMPGFLLRSQLDSGEDVAEEEDDSDLDETFSERLLGLTEMVPPKVANFASSFAGTSWAMTSELLRMVRTTGWFLVTTALLMVMPVMFERERFSIEMMNELQRNEILFGPSASKMP